MLSNSKGLEFRLGYHSLIGALSKVLGVSTWKPCEDTEWVLIRPEVSTIAREEQ